MTPTFPCFLKKCLSVVLFVIYIVVFLFISDWAVGHFADKLAPQSGLKAVTALEGQDQKKRRGYFLSHPYMYYTYKPGFSEYQVQQFNAFGHRGKDVPLEKDPGVTRIMTMGGSTTIGYPYTKNPNKTWTAQLEGLLEKRTGKDIEVINAGLHAGNSADLLLHYTFRNRHLKPDIVVLHVGGNDALAILFPNYNSEYTHHVRGWQKSSLTPRPFERFILRSNWMRIFYSHWLKRVSLEEEIGKARISGLDPAEALKNAKETYPLGFERNLDYLIRNILADGATPILFPFVYNPTKQGFREYERYYDALTLGYEKDRQVMLKLAEKYNLRVVDIPKDAIHWSHFYDFCHLNEQGDKVKAQHVADTLAGLIDSNSN